MKFGEWLLDRGKINQSDLENVLKLQSDNCRILGEMAVNVNVLKNEQLGAILDHQRERGGFIWDIALKLEFLSKDEAVKRLEINNKKNFLIGEKLVAYGAISKDDMEVECEKFHRTGDYWSYSKKN